MKNSLASLTAWLQNASKSNVEHKRQLYRKLLEDNFSEFVRAAWTVLEPATPLVWNWHLSYICETLQAIREGKVRRQLINIPPRSGKSLFATVLFPCWCWATQPSLRFLCSSYSSELSTKHSVDRRTVIMSGWYQALWGNKVQLAEDQNLKQSFMNTARGTMIAVSTGSAATGLGCDFLICDDPHSPLQALSDVERKTAIRHFNETLMTRFDRPGAGGCVVIMQRLHQEDLSGYLLAQMAGWELCELPAIATRSEVWRFPISGRVVKRKQGDLLWQERFPQEVLDGLKKQLGTSAFAGQFQQSPMSGSGNIIKREWFRFYTQEPPRTDFRRITFSCDTAYKTREDNDFSSVTIWGTTENAYYLLGELHDRLELPALKRRLVDLASFHAPHEILIEDAASGQSLIAELRASTTLPIKPIRVDKDKLVRANSCAPIIEAGKVYVPDPAMASWAGDYLDELTIFPAGRFDDRVDSTTQFLNHAREPREHPIFEYLRQELRAMGKSPEDIRP